MELGQWVNRDDAHDVISEVSECTRQTKVKIRVEDRRGRMVD